MINISGDFVTSEGKKSRSLLGGGEVAEMPPYPWFSVPDGPEIFDPAWDGGSIIDKFIDY